MVTVDDLDQAIEQFQLAQREVVKGNPEPMNMVLSHREDVTLLNPFGPPARGWEQVAAATERAASYLTDGEMVAFENVAKCVTPELAYIVLVERAKAKVGGREDVAPIALRATMIFRPEDGVWKLVYRHADPITTAQPAESIIQK
jgi:ketosteroid isomerase-like protein